MIIFESHKRLTGIKVNIALTLRLVSKLVRPFDLSVYVDLIKRAKEGISVQGNNRGPLQIILRAARQVANLNRYGAND